MTPTEVTLPDGWDCDSSIPDDVLDVLVAANCPWLQAITEVAYVLAQMLLAEEDADYRVAVAQTIGEGLLKAARTGMIPGEVVQ
jgi:hypothetical protein